MRSLSVNNCKPTNFSCEYDILSPQCSTAGHPDAAVHLAWRHVQAAGVGDPRRPRQPPRPAGVLAGRQRETHRPAV